MNQTIEDFSFVIIAANEEFSIKKCLESLNKLPLVNCEVICVDCNSKDNTLGVMLEYSKGKDNYYILNVIGDCVGLRSIARNAGFNSSSKKYVFFIDGDIEINENFLFKATKKLKEFDCVAGDLKEFLYDSNFQKINKVIDKRYNTSRERNISYTGGIFIVSREAVIKSGLFDEGIRCEDLEFTLRLSRTGHTIIQLPEIMGIHHTIDFSNKQRILNFIKIQHGIYRGILIKRNFFFPKGLYQILKKESSLFWGLPFILLCISGIMMLSLKLLLLCILLFVVDMSYGFLRNKDWFQRFYMHYIAPLFILKGILFHSHPKPGNYTVKTIKYI